MTYIFGTVGLGHRDRARSARRCCASNLAAACKDYEAKQGGAKELGGVGSAWHRWEVRAFRVQPNGKVIGLRAIEAEALLPDARIFVAARSPQRGGGGCHRGHGAARG